MFESLYITAILPGPIPMMLNDKIDLNINGSKEHRAKYTRVYFIH